MFFYSLPSGFPKSIATAQIFLCHEIALQAISFGLVEKAYFLVVSIGPRVLIP